MHKQDEARHFHAISLHSLRTETVTDFDIYFSVSASKRPRFILYRAKDVVFTREALHNLREHGVKQLFINVEDKRIYHRYLEVHLENILKDTSIAVEEKSNVAYTCAVGLVEELLEHPRSGEHIRRSKKVISHLADYLFTESRALFSLMAATAFDYYTYTHSVNVAIFGMALAQKAGFSELPEINVIGSGLIMHDIGKSIIDRSILNKKGRLNSNEWEIIKQHPENGVKLVQDLGELDEEALAIILEHHEKLDGTGYPRRLRGSDIHPYARIAALADIFDALTTQRPYKPAEKTFPALKIMRDEMAGGLDQDLFRQFVLLLGGS
jgi:putative nucleotidyltransferase with HDIG domain